MEAFWWVLSVCVCTNAIWLDTHRAGNRKQRNRKALWTLGSACFHNELPTPRPRPARVRCWLTARPSPLPSAKKPHQTRVTALGLGPRWALPDQLSKPSGRAMRAEVTCDHALSDCKGLHESPQQFRHFAEMQSHVSQLQIP